MIQFPDNNAAPRLARMIPNELAATRRWPALLRREEAAEYFFISPREISELQSANAIPFVRIGGSIRFSKSKLDEWINQQAQQKNPSP